MAKNSVIAGDYLGKMVMSRGVAPYISLGFRKELILNKSSIESYEVIAEDISKSAVSGVARGAVGAALLGPVGMLAGLSAKNKGAYTIAIKFRDGKNSLIEIDDKIYKDLIKIMF